jgi:16S rRNA (guanine966-N2)-methyltransferase
MARKRKTSPDNARGRKSATGEAVLRIIGGRFRGRKLAHSGDPRTRPMKDRVREAIFNLVGPGIDGKHAVDLFAGTGAIGFEALSRGAARATLVERHFPTVRVIRQNASTLGVEDRTEIVAANTFLWARDHPSSSDRPWAIFCSPPYDFYVGQTENMLKLIGSLIDRAPAGSVVVVEADKRFSFATLPHADDWDVRRYPPAVVGVLWTG